MPDRSSNKHMVPRTIWFDKRDWDRLQKLNAKTKIPTSRFVREAIQRVLKAYRLVLDKEDFQLEIEAAAPMVLEACEKQEAKNV